MNATKTLRILTGGAVLAAMTATSALAQGPTVDAVDNGDGTATIQVTPTRVSFRLGSRWSWPLCCPAARRSAGSAT